MNQTGPICQFLEADHRRLERLLEEAAELTPGPSIDAYETFRSGLLKHIAMEEKVLLPAARRVTGRPHPVAERLRTDHSLLATLLIPTPTKAIVAEIRDILHTHDALEEGPAGFYHAVERLVPDSVENIVKELHAFRQPTVAQHFDSVAVMHHIAELRADRDALLKGQG